MECIIREIFVFLGLLDHVTVLIGIAYKGKAIAGVINQPFYNYQVRLLHILQYQWLVLAKAFINQYKTQ